MAVYKRNYHRYDGPLTDAAWRFTIIPRFAFREVFDSRLFTGFYFLSFMPALVFGAIIYLTHSVAALTAMGMGVPAFDINNRSFMMFLQIQATLSFFIAAFVGPNVITPDLSNNALHLYLSRPVTRVEYVSGKLAVIVSLTSLTTWLSGLALFFLQSSLAGGSWMWENMRIAAAIFMASWIWILTVSLLALALSTLSKAKTFAGIFMFIAFFAAAGFGNAANSILWRRSDTQWGSLIDLRYLQETIAHWFFDVEYRYDVPLWAAFLAMLAVCVLSLLVLSRKIRAVEVVRG